MLEQAGINLKGLNVDKLKAEYQELMKQKSELTSTYKDCEKEVRELKRKQENLNQYLGRTQPDPAQDQQEKKILRTYKWAKNRGALGTPILNLLQNLQGWFIIRLENRRILECPTVAQSETYKALSLLTDYRLSPIGVEDSLSVYLRLRLLSMYVKAANTTSKSVSTSKVFIPTSFLFPERTTARLSLLL